MTSAGSCIKGILYINTSAIPASSVSTLYSALVMSGAFPGIIFIFFCIIILDPALVDD